MRMALGAALLVLGTAAQPAFAGKGAASQQGGATPLPITAAVAPALAASIASALSVLPSASATHGAPPSFRLASVTLPASATPQPAPVVGEAGLRRRFVDSRMMDYYPIAGSGLHLSGGTRLFARRNFLQETENSARGALAVSRSIMAPLVTRAGFKKFNPAVTAGYTVALSRLAQIGVEGGALMTSAFAGTPGLPHGAFGYRREHDVRPDAIANVVFGMQF